MVQRRGRAVPFWNTSENDPSNHLGEDPIHGEDYVHMSGFWGVGWSQGEWNDNIDGASQHSSLFYGVAETASDTDNGGITATVNMPSRNARDTVLLRLRHPKAAPIKAVTVNGKPWTEFNTDRETITLKGVLLRTPRNRSGTACGSARGSRMTGGRDQP